MERKNRHISTSIPASLGKAFDHKRVEEEGLAIKAVIRQLIELWVKGEIVLPNKAVEPANRRKRKLSG